jgi:hypothetical protein
MSIISRPHHSAVSQSNVTKASAELEVERNSKRNKNNACGKAVSTHKSGSGSGRNACSTGGSGSGRASGSGSGRANGYSSKNTFEKCATTINCNVAVPTSVIYHCDTNYRCAPPAAAQWAHPAIAVSAAGCNETIRPVYEFAPVDHYIKLPDVALNGGSCVTVAPIVRVGGERIHIQGGSAIDQRCAPTIQRAECVTEEFAGKGFKGKGGIAAPGSMSSTSSSSTGAMMPVVGAPIQGSPVQGAKGDLPVQEAKPMPAKSPVQTPAESPVQSPANSQSEVAPK